MKRRTGIGLAVAGLIAGLVLGTAVIASAVTSSTGTSETAPGWGHGPGGPGGFGGRGMRGGLGGPGGLASVVATLTKTDVQDVMTQREAGKSFAAIAEAKGVSSDDVIALAVREATARLDQAVKDGRMTADEEKQFLADLKTRLTEELNATGELPMRRGRGGFGGPGRLAQTVSKLTGLSVTDVMTQRRAGKSFADIAKARGVTAEQIVSEALKTATADLKSRFESEVSTTAVPGAGRGMGGEGRWGGPGGASSTTGAPAAVY